MSRRRKHCLPKNYCLLKYTNCFLPIWRTESRKLVEIAPIKWKTLVHFICQARTIRILSSCNIFGLFNKDVHIFSHLSSTYFIFSEYHPQKRTRQYGMNWTLGIIRLYRSRSRKAAVFKQLKILKMFVWLSYYIVASVLYLFI